MIVTSDILPMYPGYALGGIIRESNLSLPLYEKKRLELEEMLEKTELDKVKEFESEKYIKSEESTKQKIIYNYAEKINNINNDLSNVFAKIKELLKEANSFAIEETLPLDERVIEVRTENRAFKGENMEYILFTSKDHVLSRIESFVSNLFMQYSSSTLLPFGTLEAMAKKVEILVRTTNETVCLLGAFNTLERVKVISPLVIKPNTKLSPHLIKNAAKYCVLSEAVLGAVFLGIGKDISVSSQQPSQDINDNKWQSSLSTVSFISQGVIPKLNGKLENVNLWSIYAQWKEALATDPLSGYPIGFKVRPLQSVLEENQISLNE